MRRKGNRFEAGIMLCHDSKPRCEQDAEISRFDALTQALHLPTSEIRMLASLKAYMDESADKDQRLFIIGGFLGRSDAWRDVLFQWIDRLDPRKLPHPIKSFHMTDCENGGGEFRDEFGWDRESRKQLIIDLLDIICSAKLGMFGMAIPIPEYLALDPVNSEGVRLGKDKYNFLLQMVMTDIARELDNNDFPGHEEVAFFFDRNSPYEHWASLLHKQLQNSGKPWSPRIGTLTFHNKEKMRLLQVADIGAFESMKHLTNEFFHEGRTRRSFQKLAENHCVFKLAAFNGENLKRMVEDKREYLAEVAKTIKTRS